MVSNDFGNSGFKGNLAAIGSAFGFALFTINLRYNKISEGTSKLAKAMETNDKIAVLILWRNDVDDISAIALADMLKKNKSIQHFIY